MDSFELLQILTVLPHQMDAARKTVVAQDVVDSLPPGRVVYKPSAGVLILPQDWQDFTKKLRSLPLLMGINARTGQIEVFGGSLTSPEEMAFEAIMQGAEFPGLLDAKTQQPTKFGGAFYHWQAAHMLANGGNMVQPNYSESSLTAALREVVEEGIMGGVEVIGAFPNILNVPVLFRPFNANLRRVLEPHFPAIYEDNQVFAVQVVQQHGFFATVKEVCPNLPAFQANAEISGCLWVTLEDIIELGKKKLGQDHILPDHLQNCEIRNSIPCHFLKWFIEYLMQYEIPWTY